MLNGIKKKTISVVLAVCMMMSLLVLGSSVTVSASTSYYINNQTDFNNYKNATFSPGDRIYFAAGVTFTGSFTPHGSGTSGNPIIVDKYGTGTKPVIDANANGSFSVYLENVQYWEINNLEVVNNGSQTGTMNRQILIQNYTNGVLNHIYIKNCYAHDLKSITSGANCFFNGGICFQIQSQAAYWNDILVDGNTIENGEGGGINLVNNGGDTFAYSTNVHISNNIMSNLGADGIVCGWTNGAVVEHNVVANCGKDPDYYDGIWPRSSLDTIIQYNEVYGFGPAGGSYDGWGYDNDELNSGSIFQYNYSHGNRGFMVLLSFPVTIRYNISQSETLGQTLIANNRYDASFYNNVFYIPSGDNSDITYNCHSEWQGGVFKNNIFYNLGGGDYLDTTPTYDHNVFYRNHPSSEPGDSNKLTSDPKFVNPGSGGTGIDSVDGYKLQSDSPCINSGVTISSNGGKDYWGNTLYNGSPDRGAYEYTGGGSTSTPTPTPTPTSTSTPTPTPTPTPTGSNVTFGNIDNTTSTSWPNHNEVEAQRYQCPQDMTANKLYVRIKTSPSGAQMKCAIYADASGLPGAKLRETSLRTNPGTGWQAFDLTSSLALTGGTYYYLVFWSDNNNSWEIYQNNNSYLYEKWNWSSSTLPDPYGTSTYYDGQFCFYCEGTPSDTTVTFGNIDNTTSTSWPNHYEVEAQRYQCPQNMTANKLYIRIKTSPSGAQMKCAIYADSSGLPGAKLRETSLRTNPGTGWQAFDLTSGLALTGGTYYYLVFWSDNNNSWEIYQNNNSYLYEKWNWSSSTLPDPYGTSTYYNGQFCIYCEGTY